MEDKKTNLPEAELTDDMLDGVAGGAIGSEPFDPAFLRDGIPAPSGFPGFNDQAEPGEIKPPTKDDVAPTGLF